MYLEKLYLELSSYIAKTAWQPYDLASVHRFKALEPGSSLFKVPVHIAVSRANTCYIFFPLRLTIEAAVYNLKLSK